MAVSTESMQAGAPLIRALAEPFYNCPATTSKGLVGLYITQLISDGAFRSCDAANGMANRLYDGLKTPHTPASVAEVV